MSSRQEKLIEQYLSDEIGSNDSTVYDSDADPEFIPTRNRLLSFSSMISTHRTQAPKHRNLSQNFQIFLFVDQIQMTMRFLWR